MMLLKISQFKEASIQLPLFPEDNASMLNDLDQQREFYVTFMRNLRLVPASSPCTKVLSAIQLTADTLGYSDAHVTKELVEIGLRAPRKALPAAFLDYTDKALLRENWHIGRAPRTIQALYDYWLEQGEDTFCLIDRDFDYQDAVRA